MGLTDTLSSLKQAASGALGSLKTDKDVPALNVGVPSDFSRKIQSLKSDNWNKVYPYCFALGDASGNDGAVAGLADISNSEIFQDLFKSNKMKFLIPPSAISIMTQHAVSVTATNHGILEEHNGTVFRTIQISGNTGVLPLKTNRGNQGGTLNALKRIGNSIIPGTTAAITGFASQIGKTVNAVTGGKNSDIAQITSELEKDNNYKLQKSGYYQFWLLHNFIVAYTEIKKKAAAQDIRLLFVSPKDNIGYVVSPMGFELKRDASNPLLYRYNITLKAWDLMPQDIEAKPQDIDIPRPEAVSVIASIANLISQSRKTISAASNILSGVNSDIQSVTDVLNQTEIFFKELSGLAYDVSNFKPTFFNNRKKILLSSPNNRVKMQDAIKSDGIAGAANISNNINSFIVQSNKASASTLAKISGAGSNVSFAKPAKTTPSGEDKSSNMTDQISNQADSAVQIALGLDSFNDLTLDQLDIPTSVQKEIKAKIADTKSLSVGDIRKLSDKLGEVSDNFITSINAMDADYAAIYGVPFDATNTSTKVPTEDEILIAVAIQETRQALVSTLATGEIFKEREPNPFTSANAAVPAEDKMAVATGAIAVPWQRGSTIETLAVQYLGDSKRAREIEVLNGMRAPYIDEVGFDLSVSGANGRSFVVTSNSNLTINQEVVLSGNLIAKSRRRILNIENIGNNKSRITVNGPANLSIYAPSSSPTINAKLPGTIGPGDLILIPSNQAPADAIPERPTPLLNSLSHAEKVFKVDVALNAEGTDFDVGADGDAKRSFGYNNAVQAIRLAVETEKNELERHLGYGLGVSIGSRAVDIDVKDLEDAVANSITSDSRFIDAEVNAEIQGNVVRVNVVAFGAGQTGQIPVNFDIQRN